MAPKVLITTGTFDNAPAREGSGFVKAADMLAAAGVEIVRLFKREAGEYRVADFEGIMTGVEAVIAGSEPWGEELFKISPDLKILCRYGVGYDAVDLAAAKRHGVMVTNTQVPELSQAVADTALVLTLAVLRHAGAMHRDLKSGVWNMRMGRSLWGKTVGIVGFGAIGQCFAKLLPAFGGRILVGARRSVDQGKADAFGATVVPMDVLLAESDIVSIHVPNVRENYHLVDAAFLAKMKKGAVLINTARGAAVDEKALYDALTSGHLYGAGLDVWDKEPTPADNPLLALDNVVAQPHMGGATLESAMAIAECNVRQVTDALNGRTPQFVLNA